MRKGGGKAKGSAFEREICVKLSMWVSRDERQDLFWRSAMSGGRATVAHRKSIAQSNAAGRAWPEGPPIRQAGDICAVAPEGHALTNKFYFECKHVRYLGLDQFLVKGTGPLAKYWGKCKEEAYAHKRLPIIIARQNGWPTLWFSHYHFDYPIIQHGQVSIYLFETVLQQEVPI